MWHGFAAREDTAKIAVPQRGRVYMSPNGQPKAAAAATSNLYTVILALAFAVVLATVVFVAYKCYFQYEIIFRMP
jgi:hypothetical protein